MAISCWWKTTASIRWLPRMLDKLGLTHDIANHGGEALEKLAAQAYDLILMDMEMPAWTARKPRCRFAHGKLKAGAKRIPIIAMTANAMHEDRHRCLASGMDDHMPKPVEMNKLGELLRRSGWRSNHRAHYAKKAASASAGNFRPVTRAFCITSQ
jgi:CheY-like chemotaxis protein